MAKLRHQSFAPLVQPASRLLILGSLPSAKSLAAQQYYAHPQNQFWRLLDLVCGVPLSPLDYDARLNMLHHCRIGLWDVVQSASRRSSSDSDIKDAAPQDLLALLGEYPNISAIAFNGGKASQIGRRILREKSEWLNLPASSAASAEISERHLRLFDLPSSSAANTMAFDRKAAAWAVLAPYARSD